MDHAARTGETPMQLELIATLRAATQHDQPRTGLCLSLFLPFLLATHFAWDSEGWQRAVAMMIGVDG